MNLKTIPLPAVPRLARTGSNRDVLARLVATCPATARGLQMAEARLHVAYLKSPEDAALWLGKWAVAKGLRLDPAELLERQRQVAARLFPGRHAAA